jgi:hypothetical protein
LFDDDSECASSQNSELSSFSELLSSD